MTCLPAYDKRTARAPDEQLSQERHKADAAKHRQFRNPPDEQLSQQRHETDAAIHLAFRNPPDEQLSQQRHEADSAIHRAFRNPPDEQLSQQRHEADATRFRQFMNPPDEQLRQQRHKVHADRKRTARLPGQIARAQETPQQAQERIQRNFEARAATAGASKKACNAKAILRGDQIVEEHYLGSTRTARGGYIDKCPDCNAIRYPTEKHSICCQNAKVRLQPVPVPPPILKDLLGGQDERSRIFRKHVQAINNALAMASMKVKCKKMPHGHTPMVTIQGKVYYFIAPLEVEEGGTPKLVSLYVHDPTLRDAARKNNLYLPNNTPKKEREICETILIQLQNELMQHNTYRKVIDWTMLKKAQDA